MAYLAARDIQFGKPVSSFINARDNAMQNALVQRQQAQAEQNALFQQQRLTAQDQVSADQRKAASEKEDAAYMHNALSYLSRTVDNPQAYQSIVGRIAQDPVFLKHGGIDPQQMTPDNIAVEIASLGAKAGIAPAARYKEVKGPRGSVYTQNIDTGEQKLTVGPDNTETPNYGYGNQARLLPKEEAIAAGFMPGTVVERLPNGSHRVVSKPDTRAGGGGGLPVGALKLVDEATQAIGSSNQSMQLIDGAINTLNSGAVKLGVVSNSVNRGRNFAGASNDSSRAYAGISQTLEKLRNNYLLLAKGVQTEGDAARAWNSEIGAGVQNDNALAIQQLKKAKGLIQNMVDMQNSRIDQVYSNYGTERPQAGGQAPVTVNTPAEAAQLPAGTLFRTPDGQVRRKR